MPKSFGTAGVRGVFNRTQTAEQVYALAETIAFADGRGRYGLGWDGRKTSALLAKVVSAAVTVVGSEVVSFGLAPTPAIAFGTRHHACMAGFAVTASHNPAEFSGVKVFNKRGMELPSSDEARIERAMGVRVARHSGMFGQVVQEDCLVNDYLDSLISRHRVHGRVLKIAVDCSCGPGAIVTPRLLEALGHRVVPVNAQVSWRFPARPPEPTAKNLEDFCKTVSCLGVDFGFAHDGDADRLVMVDSLGNVVPDSVVAILALRAMEVESGTVVLSENSSTAVARDAERIGLRVVRSRVGKSFTLVESEGGVFAAEPSKIVDPRWGLWEDGINAAALIAGLLAGQKGLLSEVLGETRWTYRQVNFDQGVRMTVLKEKARELFKSHHIVEERELDGFKLIFKDESWVMFRPSGTEAKVRLYCESTDQGSVEDFVQLGTTCVKSSI